MKRLLVLTASAVFLWAGIAAAQPGPRQNNDCPMGRRGADMRMHKMHRGAPGMGLRGQGMMDRGMGVQRLLAIADEINLTEEQRDRIRSMSIAHRTERIDREADLKKARLHLMDLRTDDRAPEGEVMGAIDDLARLRADMEKMQYQHRRAVLSVLTDQQQEQLEELRQNRQGQFWNDRNDDDDEDDDDESIPPYRPRRGRN